MISQPESAVELAIPGSTNRRGRVNRPGVRIAVTFAALCILPSTTWIAIKIGLAGAGPLIGAGLRFLVAGLCLLVVCLATRTELSLPPGTVRHAVVFGVFMYAVPTGLIYVGETRISSGLAAVLFGSMPLFAVAAANRATPREPMTRAKLTGVLVGIAGLVVVFTPVTGLSTGATTILAMVGLVVAAMVSALMQVRGRTLPTGLRIRVLSAWAAVAAGLTLLAVGAIVERVSVTLDGRTIGSVLYLGVTAATGILSMFWLLERIGAVYVSLHALVMPLLALAWGTLFYGEPLTVSLLAGALIVVTGVALVTGEGVLRARDRRLRA